MVWPFSRHKPHLELQQLTRVQGKESSTASFEKTLSTLAERISKTTTHRDALLSSRRRWKVLWTLYTSFAYLLYTVILVLVTGRHNWSWPEYAAVAGGPVAIYLVRLGLNAAFDMRVNRAQRTLDDLSTQRQSAIDKFKKDTQYDSTQKLLEKYGAEKPKPKTSSTSDGKASRKSNAQQQQQQQPQRTGLPPPPTANIQRPLPPLPADALRQQPSPPLTNPQSPTKRPAQLHDTPPTAEFAPNAFASTSRPPRTPVPSAPSAPQRQWYDRLMDVLLGDDETKPSSRLALVCANPQCRLVNGQAPPGVTSLADVGRWRCAECRSWNGLSGGEGGVRDLLRDAGVDVPASPVRADMPGDDDDGKVKVDVGEREGDDGDADVLKVGDEPEMREKRGGLDTPARSTRSRARVEAGGEE